MFHTGLFCYQEPKANGIDLLYHIIRTTPRKNSDCTKRKKWILSLL